jgi:hypothetical protein
MINSHPKKPHCNTVYRRLLAADVFGRPADRIVSIVSVRHRFHRIIVQGYATGTTANSEGRWQQPPSAVWD